jgi:hypothetical protein
MTNGYPQERNRLVLCFAHGRRKRIGQNVRHSQYVVMREWSRFGDHLGERLSPRDPDTFDPEGLWEPAPLCFDETQCSMDFDIDAGESSKDCRPLLVETTNKFGSISSVYV